MNGTSRVTLRWPSLIAGALVLLALGAGLAYVAMRPRRATMGRGAPSVAPASSSGPSPAADSGLSERPAAGRVRDADTRSDSARGHRRRVRHVRRRNRPASAARRRRTECVQAGRRHAHRRADGSRASSSNWARRVRRGQPMAEIFSPGPCGSGDAIRLGASRTRCARTRAPANGEARRDRRREPAGTRNAARRAHGEADGGRKRAIASRTARAVSVID